MFFRKQNQLLFISSQKKLWTFTSELSELVEVLIGPGQTIVTLIPFRQSWNHIKLSQKRDKEQHSESQYL